MNLIDSFDSSWHPIVPLLYQEPLKTLNEKILPNISFQPARENIFKVFSMPLQDIRVVIIGQDPYPTPNTAIGRVFAVSKETKIPPSLKVIQQEIANEFVPELKDKESTKELENIRRILMEENSNWKTLEHLENQGVFLINAALTVETGKIGSHLKYWENFTKRLVSFISTEKPCIWFLWGRKAQRFKVYIKNPFYVVGYDKETIKQIPANPDKNYILQAPHPAAEIYSHGNAGFYGCNHFLYADAILKRLKSRPIIW